MAASRSVEVSPGIIWEAMSDGCLSNGPIVCVPIKDIDLMTNEQIGALARSAVWTAKLARACMLAENIIYEARLIRKPKDLLDRFNRADLAILYEFIGDDEGIDRIIDLMQPAIAEQAQAEMRVRAIKTKRAEIASGYNDIFMAIGRRDGFRCASCRNTSNDLQIDHVVPVSKDGSNDLDNLQLLCRSCNSLKGARG